MTDPRRVRDARQRNAVLTCRREEKLRDRRTQKLGLVVADRVAAVLENAQVRTLDDAMDLLGKFRRADPVVAAGENERRRGDRAKLRAQIEAPEKSAGRKGLPDRVRRKNSAVAAALRNRRIVAQRISGPRTS
jgi:hypothetical protein